MLPHGVELRVNGFAPCTLGSVWLRDSCQSAESIDHHTHQRLYDGLFGSGELTPPVVRDARLSGGTLLVDWRDEQSPSEYPLGWLEQQIEHNRSADIVPRLPPAAPAGPGVSVHDDIATWDAADWADGAFPSADFAAVMECDAACLDWLQKIRRHGFCLLHGCPTGAAFDDAEVSRVAKRAASYVRESIFGGVWRFGPSDAAAADYAHTDHGSNADTAYTTIGLPSHTDGCYVYDPPGLQMLHCVRQDATGGDNGLVDGFRCVRLLSERAPDALRVLQSFAFQFRYRDEAEGVDLRNETPAIVTDLRGRLKQVRFNNCDRCVLPIETPAEVYEAWNELSCVIKQPAQMLSLSLRPGTTLIFDNWRLLHSRTAFRGVREMRGCYMNMEDFHSRLHHLRDAVRGRRAAAAPAAPPRDEGPG